MSLPASNLNKYQEGNWPSFKGASIVFYSDNQSEVDTALELMRDYALSKATFFPGGFQAWQKTGGEIAKGANPAPAQLVFIRKLAPHDITPADFLKAMENPAFIVLDVRNDAERKTGQFKGSLHVPSDAIGSRYSEIPKDKTLLIHCATGIRAGIAYETLKAKGFKNLKVLNANVKFENGTYKITE